MKFSSVIDKFRGNRKDRRAELAERAKAIAMNGEASLDAATVGELDRLFADSGLDGAYLESQVKLIRERANLRDEIAGAENTLGDLAALHQRNLATLNRCGREYAIAARAVMQSERDHESATTDLRNKRTFLLSTCSVASASQLAAAEARFLELVTTYEHSKKQMERFAGYKDLPPNSILVGESKQNCDLCAQHYKDAAQAYTKAVAGLEKVAAEIAAAKRAAIES